MKSWWSQVNKVLAGRGCWIKLELTKRLEPVGLVDNTGWSLSALKHCTRQISTSLLWGWILKGLIMRLFFCFSLGAFTTKAKQPSNSRNLQDSKGIRARSEGRRKAAMASRKANFCCSCFTEVVLRDGIDLEMATKDPCQLVEGEWLYLGGVWLDKESK